MKKKGLLLALLIGAGTVAAMSCAAMLTMEGTLWYMVQQTEDGTVTMDPAATAMFYEATLLSMGYDTASVSCYFTLDLDSGTSLMEIWMEASGTGEVSGQTVTDFMASIAAEVDGDRFMLVTASSWYDLGPDSLTFYDYDDDTIDPYTYLIEDGIMTMTGIPGTGSEGMVSTFDGKK